MNLDNFWWAISGTQSLLLLLVDAMESILAIAHQIADLQ